MNSIMLELKDIYAGYGKRWIVEKISFSAQPGTVTLIVGRNGSGKSTLLRSIFGLIPKRQGDILLNGTRSSTPPHSMRNAGIIYQPQRQPIFAAQDVLSNLELSAGSCTKTERNVRLATVLSSFPFLKTRLRQNSGSLSGGERQQLALATVFMAKPKLLLVDEPLAGLSPALKDSVLEKLTMLATTYNCCVLLVEHDVKKAISIANEVVGLRLGQIVVYCRADEFDLSAQKRVFVE